MYNLLNVNNYIYDSIINYDRVPESFIQNQWKLMSSKLITTNLGDIMILFPGEQNNSAGPDFLNSIIRLPNGRRLKGAIEIHVNGNDWFNHRHHLNLNYDKVILHISISPPNKKSLALFEGYFNINEVYPATISPCTNSKINIETLKHKLYDLAEIKFFLKANELKIFNEEEFIFKIFSFLHFSRQLDDIKVITKKYFKLKETKTTNETIIIKLKNLVQSIYWQGGRSPNIYQPLRIPNLVYTIEYIALLRNIKKVELSHFLQFLNNKNSFKLAGLQFNIEIYVNIILPFIMSNYNKNKINQWKGIKSPRYGKVNMILKKWNIKLPLNIALSQGILFLEKSYCSSGLCENCPLFINS
jgi:hypothetical protein